MSILQARTPIIAPSGDIVTFLQYNASHWSDAGKINGRETPLNYRDLPRGNAIVEGFCNIADLTGGCLNEDWIRHLARGIEKKSQEQGTPFYVQTGPFDRGLQKGIEILQKSRSRLLRSIAKYPHLLIGPIANLPMRGTSDEEVVQLLKEIDDKRGLNEIQKGAKHLANNLLDNSLMTQLQKGLKRYISNFFDKTVVLSLKKTLRNQKLFGSGLTFFSRHPILEFEFIPFERSADIDRHANKGILRVKIELPSGRHINILSTHMQQVGKKKADLARKRQLEQLEESILQAKGPVIFAGDMNVIGENASLLPTPEYQMMLGIMKSLGLRDAFRELHPHLPGFTYSEKDNPFGKALKRDKRGIEGRLDYFFVSKHFDILAAEVLSKEFAGCSDHFPLLIKLLLT